MKSIGCALLLLFYSCKHVINSHERNVISFNNKLDSVMGAVERMNEIIENSSFNSNSLVYGIDENNMLFIDDSLGNSVNVCILTDAKRNTEVRIPISDTSQIYEFIKIADFLRKNFLTRCNNKKGKYIYLYRDDIYMADYQEDLQRFIVYANDTTEIKDLLTDNLVKAASGGKYNLAYKIIDRKGNLFLLANKDSKIWED